MANYLRNINEKKLLEKIIRMFTENVTLKNYCKITEQEAKICKEVFINDKLFNELEIPNKIKRSQVKEMASAPLLKVLNKISEQIKDNYQFNNLTAKQEEYDDNEDDLLNESFSEISLDDFAISERTRRILKENSITTLNELTRLDFNKLRFDKNYGVKTIFELQQLAGKLKDSREILSIHRKTGKQ